MRDLDRWLMRVRNMRGEREWECGLGGGGERERDIKRRGGIWIVLWGGYIGLGVV